MIANQVIRKAVRRVLIVGAMSASAAVVAPANAQEDANVLEKVVVTGSRIARAELDSPVPVQVISEQLIGAGGAQNIADVVRNLPSVGTSGFSSTNSNFATSGAGVNTVNLRNLGDNRTLVLVNGRRFVAGIAGESQVDINMIPTDFIDRVEVVTGGASAQYGSEAIAGVVNFILKHDFEGIKVAYQNGSTSEGGGGRWQASLTMGNTMQVGDHAGNFLLNVTHDVDKGLRSSERKISQYDEFLTSFPAYSSYVPQGLFLPSDDDGFTFNPDNSLHFGYSGSVYGFNRNAHRLISVPLERTLVSALFNVQIADKIESYSELTYGYTESKSALEPFPLDYSDIYSTATGDDYEDRLDPTAGMPITNAYIPAAVLAIINARNSNGPCADDNSDGVISGDECDDINSIGFRKRLLDIADRGNISHRTVFRGLIGAKGELLDDWDWDLYFMYGRTNDTQVSSGQVNVLNFRSALDSVVDAGTGDIVCRDPIAQAQGCVPVNLFGYGSISPAAAAYLTAPVTRDVVISQEVLGYTMTGTLLTLPAGDWGIAGGFEYRREKSQEIWDSLTNAGLNAGNALPNVVAGYEVKEGFVETLLPLLKEKPAVEYLGAEAAFRLANYSSVGTVQSWKTGLEYAPLRDVRLRAVFARATRAPSINELYSAPAETFPTGIQDPCDGVTATSTGQYDAACRLIPGVAAAIANTGSFTYITPLDYQNINGFDGGNPTLQEETADTTTLGLVFTPTFISGLTATVDYFDIKVKNAIDNTERQVSIDGCLRTGSPVFCQSVIRFANGKLQTVNSQFVNAAEIRTSGIDTSVRYLLNLGDFGKVDLNLAYTYLLKLEKTDFPGATPNENVGQLDGDGRLGAGFKNRATATLVYDWQSIEVTWQINYLDKIKDTLDPNNAPPDIFNDVGSHTYHNLRASYFLDEARDYELYVGAVNVFDKRPPWLPSGVASNVTGTETAADTYDPFGRFAYAGLSAKF